MKLVPIPLDPEYLQRTLQHWAPFLKDITKRSKETVAELATQIARHEVQPILVWDENENRAVALVGVRAHLLGGQLMGDVVWMTGTDRKSWQHLLPELERYLKDIGCVRIRPVCRLGWTPFLKQNGYKATHAMMEKEL